MAFGAIKGSKENRYNQGQLRTSKRTVRAVIIIKVI